jgi:hypothetical protein
MVRSEELSLEEIDCFFTASDFANSPRFEPLPAEYRLPQLHSRKRLELRPRHQSSTTITSSGNTDTPPQPIGGGIMQCPCATHLTQAGTQEHRPDPAKDLVHHRESVGLSYGAIFGREVEDVADWRRIAVKFVDGLKS